MLLKASSCTPRTAEEAAAMPPTPPYVPQVPMVPHYITAMLPLLLVITNTILSFPSVVTDVSLV